MHSHRRTRIRFRSRAAFTLVELLVSLVLIAVGLLALSATTALVVREVGSAAARAMAGTALRNRVERFMLLSCGATSGAAEWPHGVGETWQTTFTPRGASLRDSAMVVDRGRRRSIVVEAHRPCA